MSYLSDIEIAHRCKMQPISEIAEAAGIDEKYVELYGRYKAKIDLSIMKENKRPDGKLILVTAITPTPAGSHTPPVPVRWSAVYALRLTGRHRQLLLTKR